MGTPSPLPYIHGLAIRLPDPTGGFADLLLATTAWNRIGCHVLVPTLAAAGPTLTTLLPYRTAVGPVVVPVRPRRDGLSAVLGTRRRPLAVAGRVIPHVLGTADATVSFDPIRQHPPGLTHYPLFIRLRERSYATARAHRHLSHGEPC